jgi:hypothetical protein
MFMLFIVRIGRMISGSAILEVDAIWISGTAVAGGMSVCLSVTYVWTRNHVIRYRHTVQSMTFMMMLAGFAGSISWYIPPTIACDDNR